MAQMKVTYYVGSSLDGFIAGTDDDMSWLEKTGVAMSDTNYDSFLLASMG